MSEQVVRTIAPGAFVVDDLLSETERALVDKFLREDGWKWGWKSHGPTDVFRFWHRHFAGHKKLGGKKTEKCPCEDELQRTTPFLFDLWSSLKPNVFVGHTLYRCYANAQSYGSDGTIHTDSNAPNSYTAVYYPHAAWEPNWAGETVLFNDARDDIVASVYPRPNRLLVFLGNIPHAARGVSRTCPVLRVTLIFKSEMSDAVDDVAGSGTVLAEGERAPDQA